MPQAIVSLTEPAELTDTGIFTIIYNKTAVGVTIIRVQLTETDLPYTPPSIVAASVYVVIQH